MRNKNHLHSAYCSFYVKDPKLRHIHKATVKDRVLHHAIFRVLYPLFDKSFIFDSYSCRIGKGTHRAVNRLDAFAIKESRNNSRNCYVLKCDVRKFFDSINQDVLVNLIKRKIKDKNAIWLINNIIKSYSTDTNTGIPLGNITSQLFANIYLNELDNFVKQKLRIKYYIRYCDDFLVLNESELFLQKLIPVINSFLKNNLHLSLHPNKITIRKYRQGIDFLGYVCFPYHRILRPKTKKRILRRIREKVKVGEKMSQTLQSYFGVLKHCNSHKITLDINYIR